MQDLFSGGIYRSNSVNQRMYDARLISLVYHAISLLLECVWMKGNVILEGGLNCSIYSLLFGW